MNKEQLDAIKERANKATEGPWKIFEDSEVKAGCQIGTAWDHPQAKGPVGIVNLATSVTGGEIKNCVYIQSDDARFIAHARQDVPALVAEVERLRERVALDFFRCGETTTAFAESVEENKRLRDENKKLQKAMIEIKHSNINLNPNQQLDNLHAYCIAVATKALEDEECS